ncbi:MAG: hypothetical protein ACI9R3_004245 [Verrucomicrobiales bacterium]|jgi:hypothetical protein
MNLLISPTEFLAALVILFQFGGGIASAQSSGSAQLHLNPQADSISFRLSGIPEADAGQWVLQSSADLDEWEYLAFFGKSAAPGADLELELANQSMPQAGGAQQFFRARYLESDDPLLREFLTARNLWRRSGINRYVMEVRWQLSQFTWHGTVTVSNGQVTSSETITTNFFEPPEPKTMDEWFDHLKRFIDQPADQIIVTYDPVFGYPDSVSIDEDFRIADEEQSWSILDFLPGR